MSNSSLKNKKRRLVQNSTSNNIAKKKKLEDVNPKLLNTIYSSTNNIDESFENLCKQKSIKDENILKVYRDVAITGKFIQNIVIDLKR